MKIKIGVLAFFTCFLLNANTVNAEEIEEPVSATVTDAVIEETSDDCNNPDTAETEDVEDIETVDNVNDYVSGWFNYGNLKMYYNSETGTYSTGLSEIDGKKYFFYDNGVMYQYCGIPKINGYRYWFGSDCSLGSGWYEDGSIKMYFSPTDYKAVTGVALINGSGFLFDDNGLLYEKSGICDINGKIYYIGQDASLLSGWIYYGNNIMYFDPYNFEAKTGVSEIGGKQYLFDNNGFLNNSPGTQLAADGKKYWIDYDGSLKSGWLIYGNWKLYFDPVTFEAKIGLSYIDGTAYLFNPDGILYECEGVNEIDGEKYLFSDGFSLKSGWYDYDNHTMYFSEEDYKAVKGTVTIEGKNYYFNGSGYLDDASEAAVNILNQVGWSLETAFTWSSSFRYYSGVPEPNIASHLTFYANYGFENQCGNCYVMASVFCAMARVLGYNAYLVEGTVPLRGGGMGPHGWVEIDQDGGVYVYDPDFTNETKRNGFKFTYGTSGTWRYTDYRRVD